MAVSEQARLATVKEHVRGENAGDKDVIMGTLATALAGYPWCIMAFPQGAR